MGEPTIAAQGSTRIRVGRLLKRICDGREFVIQRLGESGLKIAEN
jgi:hypothetical protein